MTDAQFQTFLTGGLGFLVVTGLLIAWLLWRDREDRRQCADEVLAGVGYELKASLQRTLSQLEQLAQGQKPPGALAGVHPQLDAVTGSLMDADRRAVAILVSHYEDMDCCKSELSEAISARSDISDPIMSVLDRTIDGVAKLYLWERHSGVAADEAPSTRSWDVRDWMKAEGFPRLVFEDVHLRDAVVERLRSYGMPLTPMPLTHTASEYYAMQYDRKADPRGVFGARRTVAPQPEPVAPAGDDPNYAETASA